MSNCNTGHLSVIGHNIERIIGITYRPEMFMLSFFSSEIIKCDSMLECCGWVPGYYYADANVFSLLLGCCYCRWFLRLSRGL